MNQPTASPSTVDEVLQVVGFRVADEEFAMDILEIVGIERLEHVLQLPKMPTFVEGVMRIRDEVVPLVKLRTRFGFPEKPHDGQARVIVIEIGDDTIALIVDSVSNVRRFTRSQVEPAPPLALTLQSHFVKGVLRAEDHMIILLNPYEILFSDEKNQLRSAVAGVERAVGIPS